MTEMIYKAQKDDAVIVAKLAAKIWTSATIELLVEEFNDFLVSSDSATYLYIIGSTAIGFAQCQLRYDYVEGTDSSPVGYLEGVYVEPDFRKLGYGKALVKACEDWAKDKGCTEFASDCELHNTDSLAFHLHSGFTDANRIICFTKKL